MCLLRGDWIKIVYSDVLHALSWRNNFVIHKTVTRKKSVFVIYFSRRSFKTKRRYILPPTNLIDNLSTIKRQIKTTLFN